MSESSVEAVMAAEPAQPAHPARSAHQAGRTASRKRLGTALVALALAAASLVLLLPLYLIVLMALSPADQVFSYPPDLWPNSPTLDNFPTALTDLLPFELYFRNTLIVAGLVVIGDVISSSLVAYGFARFRFPGRDVLFLVLLSTLMLPFIVRLVPLFILFKNLGWTNTFLPLVVPPFFGTPLYIFLMRQFFLTIPADLVDAARIDGANEFGIWWRIMLPLSKPALVAVAIFSFQDSWNDFLAPLIFLQREEVKTVILGVYGLMGMFVEWNLVMAAVVVAVLPMVALFFVFQRFFIKGLVVGAVKG